MAELKKTDKSTVRRVRERGQYDRETLNQIVDDAMICHVAYIIDGAPYCTPTLVWREGDYVYWHGSSISRFLGSAIGAPVCLTVTHMDGLVLARSAFHHSANYRSAMLFGHAEMVEEPHKSKALQTFVEGLIPGRWEDLRPMTPKEVGATTVLRMKIDEGAAKIRAGGPKDDRRDYELSIWAGVLPMKTTFAAPQPDPQNLDGVDMPEYINTFIKDHS